jgi:RHS repeat-associated protein
MAEKATTGAAPARGLASAAVALLLLLTGSLIRAAEVVEYYHLDAIGNVRAVTNAAGQVVERHDYMPFGEECTTGPCSGNLNLGSGQPKRFTGKERDVETGLDYFGARYYGSKIGRFSTVDPYLDQQAALFNPQRWNRYAYGLNNPLRFIDPDGREVPVVVDGRMHNMGTELLPAGTVAQGNQAFGVLVGVASLGLPDPTDIALAPIAARLGRVLAKALGKASDDAVDVFISHRKSSQAAKHIDDAQAAGHPDVVTLDRGRTRPNRRDAQRGHARQKDMDLDEYPPACCAEGGTGASVRPIPKGDNRSAGAQLRNQVRGLEDGTRVRIRTTNE